MNRYPEEPVLEDLFTTNNPQLLCKHLSKFAIETRKTNGKLYPPSTIHSLLCGLLRHMRNTNPDCPNFLDKKDARFLSLHKTLDSLFNRLHSEGIGRQIKKAEVFSIEDENMLWNSGVPSRSAKCCIFYQWQNVLSQRWSRTSQFKVISATKNERQVCIIIMKMCQKIEMEALSNCT